MVRLRWCLVGLARGSLFLIRLFGRRPFNFTRKIDPLCCDPFIKTFVELFIMNVKLWFALASLNGKNLSFALFAVL